MIKYKTGDIVRLKSGGPDMTVEDGDVNRDVPFPFAERGVVRCQWFGGRKLDSGLFHQESLIRAQSFNGDDSQ
jgi:uncharacterized protein YodC (DUF2158 family)